MLITFDFLDRITKHSLPRILPTLIVCGDCAGDELLPVKTNLTSDGRCAVCGGRSFELASQVCGALSQHLKGKIQQERKFENYESRREQNTNTE